MFQEMCATGQAKGSYLPSFEQQCQTRHKVCRPGAAGVEGRAHKEARREKERGEEEERRLQVEWRLQEERRLQKERRLQVEPRLQEGEGTSLQSEEISSLKKQLGHKVTPLLCNAYTLVAAQCPFMISGIVSN